MRSMLLNTGDRTQVPTTKLHPTLELSLQSLLLRVRPMFMQQGTLRSKKRKVLRGRERKNGKGRRAKKKRKLVA